MPLVSLDSSEALPLAGSGSDEVLSLPPARVETPDFSSGVHFGMF